MDVSDARLRRATVAARLQDGLKASVQLADLRRQRLALREAQIVRAVPARPLVDHLVGILALADAAVVARQRARDVVVLALEIGRRIAQPMRMFSGDFASAGGAACRAVSGQNGITCMRPDGARVRDRVAVEAALDVDDGHDEARRQAHFAGAIAPRRTRS